MVLVRVEELSTRCLQYHLQHPRTSSTHTAHTCRSQLFWPSTRTAARRERRPRPRDPPRSSQRQSRYRCRTCTCVSQHARKDGAHKRTMRFKQWRARATRGWKDQARCKSMSSRGGPAHKIAARSLRCDRAALSRARQRPHGRLSTRRSAEHIVGGRQASAATILPR